MRLILPPACAAALLLAAAPASAQDRDPCPANMVCASSTDSVVRGMQRASLTPRLSKDASGNPLVESNLGNWHYDVYFRGCEQNRNCDSLRFEVVFDKAPPNALELANKWNGNHRFLAIHIAPDGRLVGSYDLGTIGGLTERNFADVLDWWGSQLGEMADFFRAELQPGPSASQGKRGIP